MFRRLACAPALLAAVLIASPVFAHGEADSGFKTAALSRFSQTADKLIQLAEAIPADKMSYRPAAGVRTASEVIGHVVNANGFLIKPLGGVAPEGAPQDAEKETDKTKVVGHLKASIAAAKQALEGLDETKLNGKYPLFGREMSGYQVALIILGHVEEHLGQLIAYARGAGVTPPWSARE